MTAGPTPELRQSDPPRYWLARRSERARDFTHIGAGLLLVLLLLTLSGALGLIEAVMAAIVTVAGIIAFFIASSPSGHPAAAQAHHNAQPAANIDIDDIVRSLPLPALHIKSDGHLQSMNEQAESVFRTRARTGALAGSFIRSNELLEAIATTSHSGEGGAVEFQLGGGSDDIWLAHLTRRAGPGDAPGVLIVLQERTSLRRAEKARADFLANASHELRTPLTSLKGYIETLQGPARDDPESWDRFLAIMAEQAGRMDRLITDLLSLSRIELSAHLAPDKIVDFNDLARSAVEALQPVAEARTVALTYEAPGAPLPILALPDEITQVVQNFATNALKYAPEGGAVAIYAGHADTLEAAQTKAGRQWETAEHMTLLEPRASAGPGIWLRVEDNGPGIEREHLPRLSQRFYRVDEDRGRNRGGTGLGLAIVKHIMTRHRGGMIVESEPGRGSAFGVWLPAHREAAQISASA